MSEFFSDLTPWIGSDAVTVCSPYDPERLLPPWPEEEAAANDEAYDANAAADAATTADAAGAAPTTAASMEDAGNGGNSNSTNSTSTTRTAQTILPTPPSPPIFISPTTGIRHRLVNFDPVDGHTRTRPPRGRRIVQVLARGGRWVDVPRSLRADNDNDNAGRGGRGGKGGRGGGACERGRQRQGGGLRGSVCYECPPFLVLSDGEDCVTVFLTPPSSLTSSAVHNDTTERSDDGNHAGSVRQAVRPLPPIELSRFCTRGAIVRVCGWRYTTVMRGAGVHYRHLTSSSMGGGGGGVGTGIGTGTIGGMAGGGKRGTGGTRTNRTVCAALPLNAALSTPLALTVPWDQIDFIAGENGTVPLMGTLRDVNDNVEVRRVLMAGTGVGVGEDDGGEDDGGDGNNSADNTADGATADDGAIVPRQLSHYDLVRRIERWESFLSEQQRLIEEEEEQKRRNVEEYHRKRWGGVDARRMSQRGRLPPRRHQQLNRGGSSSEEPRVLKRGDPDKMLAKRTDLSALLLGDDDSKPSADQDHIEEGEGGNRKNDGGTSNKTKMIKRGDPAKMLAGRIDLSSLLLGSGGASSRQSLPSSQPMQSLRGRNYEENRPKSPNQHQHHQQQRRRDAVPIGNTDKYTSTVEGRLELRNVLAHLQNASSGGGGGGGGGGGIGASEAAVPMANATSPSAGRKGRRRGGVPQRRNQPRALFATEPTEDGPSGDISEGQQMADMLQRHLGTNPDALHMFLQHVMSSGVEPEDDTERDEEEVPAPKKLPAVEANAEPMDLTFLLSDSSSDGDGDSDSDSDSRIDDGKVPADTGETGEENEGADEDTSPQIIGIGDMLLPPTQDFHGDKDEDAERVETGEFAESPHDEIGEAAQRDSEDDQHHLALQSAILADALSIIQNDRTENTTEVENSGEIIGGVDGEIDGRKDAENNGFPVADEDDDETEGSPSQRMQISGEITAELPEKVTERPIESTLLAKATEKCAPLLRQQEPEAHEEQIATRNIDNASPTIPIPQSPARPEAQLATAAGMNRKPAASAAAADILAEAEEPPAIPIDDRKISDSRNIDAANIDRSPIAYAEQIDSQNRSKATCQDRSEKMLSKKSTATGTIKSRRRQEEEETQDSAPGRSMQSKAGRQPKLRNRKAAESDSSDSDSEPYDSDSSVDFLVVIPGNKSGSALEPVASNAEADTVPSAHRTQAPIRRDYYMYDYSSSEDEGWGPPTQTSGPQRRKRRLHLDIHPSSPKQQRNSTSNEMQSSPSQSASTCAAVPEPVESASDPPQPPRKQAKSKPLFSIRSMIARRKR